MNMSGEITSQTNKFVFNNNSSFVPTGMTNDGKNYIIHSENNFFKFDVNNLSFTAIDGLYRDNKVVNKLVEYDYNFYIEQLADGAFVIKNIAGETIIDNIKEFEFVEDIEMGALLKFVSNDSAKAYLLFFDTGIAYKTFSTIEEKDNATPYAINPDGSINSVRPYYTASIYYYYSYTSYHSTSSSSYWAWFNDHYEYTISSFNWSLPGYGWSFAGWSTSSTGTGVDYSAGSTYHSNWVSSNETHQYFAVFTRTVNYSYMSSSGLGSKSSYTQKGGVWNYTVTSVSITSAALTYWTFSGFGYGASTSVRWSGSAGSAVSCSMAFTRDNSTWIAAIYYKSVTVTYYGNGGTTDGTSSGSTTKDQSVTMYYNTYTETTRWYSSITLLGSSTFKRNGYTFVAWGTSSSSTSGTAAAGPYSSYTLYDYSVSTNTYKRYAIWTANKYTITFNVNASNNMTSNGTTTAYFIYDTYILYKDSACTNAFTSNKITIPTRNGYSFSGYYTGDTAQYDCYANEIYFYSSGVAYEDFHYRIYGNITLYAHWTPNKYKITFNANGGTLGTSEVWFIYGESYMYSNSGCTTKISAIAPPTKTGYTFNYYETHSAQYACYAYESYFYIGGNWAGDTYTDIYGDITLYASWSAVTYTFTLSGNGGTISSHAVSSGLSLSGTTFTATYDTTGVFTASAVKTGYMFAGWSVSTGIGTCTPKPTDTTYSSFTNYYDTTAKSDTATAIGVTTTVKNIANTQNAAVTLTAQWTAITYYISFNGDGGTASSATKVSGCSATNNVVTATYGTTAVFTNSAVRTGYRFNGWTGGAGTLSAIPNDTNYSDFTKYYNAKGESKDPVIVKTSATNLTTKQKATVELKVSWLAITYKVSYDSNKPGNATKPLTGTVGDSTLTYDNTTEKFATNAFVLEGWTFVGWAKKSDASSKDFDSNGTQNKANLTTIHNGTVTLYAVWSANTYTINLDLVGGTIVVSSNAGLKKVSNTQYTATYDTQGTLEHTIVKQGYKFLGWEKPATAGGDLSSKPKNVDNYNNYYITYTDTGDPITVVATIKNLTSTNGGSVKLTALWESIKYKVTLSAGDGGTVAHNSLISSTSIIKHVNGTTYEVSYGSTQWFKATAVRTGYMFFGWTHKTGMGTITAKPSDISETTYPTFDAYYNANTDSTKSVLIDTSVNNLTDVAGSEVVITVDWEPITYYVRLVANGSGAEIPTQTAGTGSEKVETNKFKLTYDVDGAFNIDAKRNGYKFDGWKVSTNITGSYANSKPHSSSTFADYYALAANRDTAVKINVDSNVFNVSTNRNQVVDLSIQWKAITYKIAYNSNKPKADTGAGIISYYGVVGTTSSPSSAAYDANNTLSINGFSIIGWTYLGWHTSKTATSQQFTSGQKTTYNFTTVDLSTVTLYAVWRQNNYTISYNLSGGSRASSKSYPESVKFDAAFKVSIPVRTGYTFVNYTMSTFTTNNVKMYGKSESSLNNLSESTTTFDTATITGKQNGEIVKLSYDTFYKNLSSKDNDTITFVAHWEANKYSIAYEFSNGKKADGGYYPTEATYDIQFTVPNPVRFGYTFTGWDITGMDTACTHYYGSSTTTDVLISKTLATTYMNLRSVAGTVTFTATWRNNVYNVTYYYLNGSPDGKGTMTFDIWSNVPNPLRTGYTFTGWYINDMSDTCPHYYNTSKTITADGTTEKQSLEVDQTIVYYLNLHSEDKAEITFTAKWRANKYKISYQMTNNGQTGELGTVGEFPVIAEYDKTIIINAPTIFPHGYHFDGWLLTNMSTDCNHYFNANSYDIDTTYTKNATYQVTLNDKYFKNLHSGEGAVVILKPNWQPNVYNIKYILTDNKGGDGHFDEDDPAPGTAKYDEIFTVPTPIRTGYTFIGWKLSTLSDEHTSWNYSGNPTDKNCYHYHSSPEVKFTSKDGKYTIKDNPNQFIVVESGIFKNLHCETGATVTLTAHWQANTYTITYHYLSNTYDTSSLTMDNLNVFNKKESLQKNQTVVYDSYFTTMKMAKSDADTTGVVVPDNVKIVYWVFYADEISDATLLAEMVDKIPVPKSKYKLGVGVEYVYSSYVIFGEYPLFGQDVHAYAIYGFTDIEVHYYSAESKIGFNNLALYTKEKVDGAIALNDYTFPSTARTQAILGYMISSNYYPTGELNRGSITTFKVNKVSYTALAGKLVKWGYNTSLAQDPENPVFYAYAVYDCSMQTYYMADVDDDSPNAIKLNTAFMMENGKTYTITIRGVESANNFDYSYVKLGESSISSNYAFDKVYAHSNSGTSSLANFKVEKKNNTTITITFTANSNCYYYNLFLFYDESYELTTEYVKSVEVVIRQHT